MSARRIFAAGGAFLKPDDPASLKLSRHVLELCGADRPCVVFVPTASGDSPDYIEQCRRSYEPLGAEVRVLRFFSRTPLDLRAALEGAHAIHVGGGNTRSLLAVWRHWGFDAVLREAYARGVLLCGSSAGSICWFEEGVTDSVDEVLTPLRALGFLAGSHCPHYDGEAERRPAYHRLVAAGAIGGGIAIDDGVGVLFVNERIERVVTSRPAAGAYRVDLTPEGPRETALRADRLP